MPSAMFIYKEDKEAFEPSRLKQNLESIEGVSDINGENLSSYVVACHYEYNNYQVTARLQSDFQSISVERDSETALNFALELQKYEEGALRVFDESYTYHFSLQEIQSLEELKHKAYQEGYFDELALRMEAETI